ncbi:hypothetical protein [Pseudomonas sp. B21-053]|uniref:hypothetical protein n=1 Tax=Pseudomonas sp. B21-053 TaxID=2895493 RepID=UPI0022314A06|nr:hypothetical protein [Pseudomonas sp. B21-053]UZE12804.1 hypothetical protein LOY68_04115 [Pseudomonas sp. B21-053]
MKSHLIPLAFSAPSEGCYFIDGAPGGRPTRRPTSWYDRELVTRSGEDILADLDSFAATELRRARLVWSGWGKKEELRDSIIPYPNSDLFVRLVPDLNVLKLRVFFLSLLWRAAASDMPQNANIKLQECELEKLRLMVLNKNPYPLSFFPVQLTQMITRGPRHNLGPLKMTTPLDAGAGNGPLMLNSYRFYFDGLIANIHTNVSEKVHAEASAIYVGGDANVIAICVKFEDSFQASNMIQHGYEAFTNHQSTMLKLLK